MQPKLEVAKPLIHTQTPKNIHVKTCAYLIKILKQPEPAHSELKASFKWRIFIRGCNKRNCYRIFSEKRARDI